MSYAKKIQKHLSKYKDKAFPSLKPGWYRGNEYGHIFPTICGELNLLESYRESFLKSDLSSIKFHRYFHHLNSSQAMCINFFYPLIEEKKLDMILQKLGLELDDEEVKYDSVVFEKESTIDDKEAIAKNTPILKQQGAIPTSFDFYFETVSGKKLYFEIKYTESEFDKKREGCNGYEEKYKPKYDKIYKEAANGKITSERNNERDFLGSYQIMRNLIHVDDDSYVVFVIPKENTKVYDEAKDAKGYVQDKYKNNVKVLTWDELYQIEFDGNLKEYYQEFRDKYKLK